MSSRTVLSVLAALALACSSDKTNPPPPAQGTLGGACFANGTCNIGLVCANDVCVSAADGGATDGGAD
jgi:hypothetical protein